MSDTPKTDSKVLNVLAQLGPHSNARLAEMCDFARELERENAKLRKIAAYVPGGVWIIAEERAGFGNAVKCNEKV